MILEGLCTTISPHGVVNIAPMGPVVDEQQTTFLFRPFQTSTTFANLKETGCGVFHVTDDVELIARAVIGELHQLPDLQPAVAVRGNVLANACRWYEFEVVAIDETHERTEIQTRIVHVGRIRDFWGFNRAKHAVLETAILASRLHLLSPEEVERQLLHLAVIVRKTAGRHEQTAFELLQDYIQDADRFPEDEPTSA